MSKRPNKQSHLVTLHDGTHKEVCCGPAIVTLGDAVSAYVPIPEIVQCQNRGNIDRCPIAVMRAEARKKTEQRISKLRARAGILNEEANRLERGINANKN
jgi:hypothetical protein